MTGTQDRKYKRWRDGHTLLGAFVAAIAVVATWDTWTEIARFAILAEDCRQVFLIPPIVVWLFWVRRHRTRYLRRRATPIGPAIVLGGVLLAWLGDRTICLLRPTSARR